MAHFEDPLRTAKDVARKSLDIAQGRQKKAYDQALFQATYEVGDLVYVLYFATKPAFAGN